MGSINKLNSTALAYLSTRVLRALGAHPSLESGNLAGLHHAGVVHSGVLLLHNHLLRMALLLLLLLQLL